MKPYLWLLLSCLCTPAQDLAIRNVNVIEVESGTVRKSVNVIIVKGRVAGVGTAFPPKLKSLDGKGKFLIPGLWDMHVHLWDKEPMFNLYLANGVTGVRDMGSDFDRVQGWRKAVAGGKIIGPKIYTSGSPVDGPATDVSKFPVMRTTARRSLAGRLVDDQGADRRCQACRATRTSH
ncbi:MAG: hypothetical protein WKF37_07925 [Bryobacteraceae bacterium]